MTGLLCSRLVSPLLAAAAPHQLHVVFGGPHPGRRPRGVHHRAGRGHHQRAQLDSRRETGAAGSTVGVWVCGWVDFGVGAGAGVSVVWSGMV